MQTQMIPVAPGIELAVDRWYPGTSAGAAAAAFVLVHGLASNARLWDGVAEHLAANGHTAFTVDLRGHGRSSKVDSPYDVPTVAEDLAALIERLDRDASHGGYARPIVAGQSWGGNVVLELAARHPTRVRGIVLVDGGWLEPSAGFEDWEACRAALAPPRLVGRKLADVERHVRGAHPDWPEAGVRGTLANFEHRADGTVAPWLTFDRHITILRGLWEHHPGSLYGRVAVPTLLAPVDGGPAGWAERKRADVATALAALSNARAHWFSGDHDIHAQRPIELADVMLSLLEDKFFGGSDDGARA